MAQFKDLIVNGSSRIIGKIYGHMNGKLTIGSQVYDGSTDITVPAATVSSTSVTPTTSSQSVTVSTGYVNSAKTITVNAVSLSGSATQAQVLNGKTFYSNSLTLQSGTMTDRGAITSTISTQNGTYTIPAGYHNGSGVITATLGTATFSKNGGTITASSSGYIANNTTVGTVTASDLGLANVGAATTVYATTSSQTIMSANQYRKGAITLGALSSSNYSASNIKHGTTISVSNGNTNVYSVEGTFYNDGTTYTLSSVGTKIDMGASTSHRYITTSGLQVIPNALYTATGAVTTASITNYGSLTIPSASTFTLTAGDNKNIDLDIDSDSFTVGNINYYGIKSTITGTLTAVTAGWFSTSGSISSTSSQYVGRIKQAVIAESIGTTLGSVSGSNIELSTTNNSGISVSGRGTINIGAQASSTGYVYQGMTNTKTSYNSDWGTMYVNGVMIGSPTSGTRSFYVEVPNGDTSNTIRYIFTVDSNKNVTITGENIDY